MRVYVYRGVGARLRRLGARRALDVALCDPDILRLTGRVRVVLSPRTSTAAEVAERRRGLERLSTGSSRLDELLGGGLEVGYITELVGEYGAGKTQLCHQLAVMVQLPREEGGLEAKALYIDTEGTFRPERIVSMAEYRGLDPREALENIVYVEARGEGALISAVAESRRMDVRLVVVDTLIAPLPLGEGVEGLARRQFALTRLMRLLREVARGGRVVVVANRMSADRPAGGLALALGSHYRLMMRRSRGDRRVVELLRAPHLPPGSATVRIAEEGVLDA
ncbi:MAG: DNA repair and recombination protein RadA [Thermoprotei archaeon]|nr:MAG: DNA repair and recombination protein RadA [Thermoprotei archaeon]